MLVMDDYATDWAQRLPCCRGHRHTIGCQHYDRARDIVASPSDHDTLPAPPPDTPEQSFALRTALEMYGRMSDEDVLRFSRAIRQVKR